MKIKNVTISVNLEGIRNQLTISLKNTTNLVAFGLQRVDDVDTQNLILPIHNQVDFNSSQEISHCEIKKQFTTWVISNGFRDCIEAVSKILLESNKIFEIWSRLDDNYQFVFNQEMWDKQIDNRKFHFLGFPKKVDHLNEKLGLDLNLRSHVTSINAARNCLVHRNGIVDKKDCLESNRFIVSWRRMYFFFDHGDREEPLIFDQDIFLEKDTPVCMRYEDISKTLSVGEAINFSVEEFSEICWSLFLFGEDLIQKMGSFGLRHGFLKPTESTQRA